MNSQEIYQAWKSIPHLHPAIKALMLELVGEDEISGDFKTAYATPYQQTRNQLRQKLRESIKAL